MSLRISEHSNRAPRSSLIGAALAVLVIGAALAACSEVAEQVADNGPGVAEAEALIQDAVARNSAGRLKFVSIAKTGGRQLKAADKDGYELWYSVTAELTQDALWSRAALRRFSTLPAGSPEGFLFHAGKAGEQVSIPGALTFLKERNEWKAEPDERYQ
jgi:hypothetical protein